MRKLPTELKILRGTLRKCRENKNEPKPEVEIPDCPAHLTPEAKTEWRRLSKELHALGILTKLDRAVLAAYCQSWGRLVEAETHLRDEGPLIKTPGGFEQPSPWLAISSKALTHLKAFATQLGLTPVARSSVSAVPLAETVKDPWADL
jgi:P27 family predicted phage terminase small subunit